MVEARFLGKELSIPSSVKHVVRRLYDVSSTVAHGFYHYYYGGARDFFEEKTGITAEARFDAHMKLLEMEHKIHAATLVGSRLLATPIDPLVFYRMYERATLNIPGLVLDSHIPMMERGAIAYWLAMKVAGYTGNPVVHLLPGSRSNSFLRRSLSQLWRTMKDPVEELPTTVLKTEYIVEDVVKAGVRVGVRVAKKGIHIGSRLVHEPVDLLCDGVDYGVECARSGVDMMRTGFRVANYVVEKVPPLNYIKEQGISAGELMLEPVVKLDEWLALSQQPELPREFILIEYKNTDRRRINL